MRVIKPHYGLKMAEEFFGVKRLKIESSGERRSYCLTRTVYYVNGR